MQRFKLLLFTVLMLFGPAAFSDSGYSSSGCECDPQPEPFHQRGCACTRTRTTEQKTRIITTVEINSLGELDRALDQYANFNPSLDATAECNDWGNAIKLRGVTKLCSWKTEQPMLQEIVPVPQARQQLPQADSEHELVVLDQRVIRRGEWAAMHVDRTEGADMKATFECNNWETTPWPPLHNPKVYPGDVIKVCARK
ncbi:MAG: hypothetical protein ACD_76C00162G0005 [uncultured bacterium]|nr:MAG: hypothetical protein ACD_76C00162G0005 [uncultured bacterium]HBD05386.1 hypothetical protein [Candidatus Uhrbacteria bacterium]